MLLRFVFALSAVVSIAQPAFSASQDVTTPYEDIKTQLALEPGQTYLSFMQKEVKPGLDAYQKTIEKDPASRAHNYRQLQLNLIEKGAGVALRIDANNYIFNIGYLDGSDPKNDVKSGRSYGVGPSGTQSDPSDVAYLRELESYLKAEPQAAGDFVEALMKVITDCDPSGWAKLSEDGQSVATDFLAIYTAELDRHLMVNLNVRQHPWEIDLAAATFVSIFDVESGLIFQNGEFSKGSIKNWWAQGQSGSGIGNTRRDRLALQKLIAQVEEDSKEAKQLLKLVGGREDGDVIQGVLEYLNSNEAPESMSSGEGEQLTRLMRDYLANVQAHSDEIAAAR